jgi:5'-deoxynucleotidase YfbR-like HD superfamily hydrolase|tara:strand:+ start:2432 stop:2953 length:522 start_codon:yes stop_codon:yes gene_type:complete
VDTASNRINYEKIETIYDAQFINRYHTVPLGGLRQTVGAHSYAVVVLLDQLWDNCSKNLLLSALYHDVPEIVLGDIPATAKWEYPELKKAFKKAEDKVSKELGIEFVLTTKELNRLKMADMLELVMYCHKLNDSNSRMKLIMHTGVTYLMDNYSQLPDFDPVSQILKKLKLII